MIMQGALQPWVPAFAGMTIFGAIDVYTATFNLTKTQNHYENALKAISVKVSFTPGRRWMRSVTKCPTSRSSGR
jgi:hypothetical protein